jgi:hypothetical protein
METLRKKQELIESMMNDRTGTPFEHPHVVIDLDRFYRQFVRA